MTVIPMSDKPAIEPRLLKKRQKHSRVFAVLLVLSLLVVDNSHDTLGIYYEMATWTGVFLIAMCVLGRSYCSAFIGGIKNDVVMRDGPFSIVRNPLYVFSFLGVLGIGLVSHMATVFAVLVVSFIVYYKFVVAREEAFLLNKFGDQYKKYFNEVPRWFPKWSLWHEPEQITVRPKFLRRTMMDALVFFLPVPFFAVLDYLHEMEMLPVYIFLP
jgi:protein-S-isoprenylcysteine O-methyltransferase Ste14